MLLSDVAEVDDDAEELGTNDDDADAEGVVSVEEDEEDVEDGWPFDESESVSESHKPDIRAVNFFSTLDSLLLILLPLLAVLLLLLLKLLPCWFGVVVLFSMGFLVDDGEPGVDEAVELSEGGEKTVQSLVSITS